MNDIMLGYCTNVHAGINLETTRANLEQHALEVKRIVAPNQPMGIGLWLSATTAKELSEKQNLSNFKSWLNQHELIPFTLNGFPYGDFHQTVVKHQVYLPTWADTDRFDYTCLLAELLDELLPEGQDGSISTLPLGWGKLSKDDAAWEASAAQLRELAEILDRVEIESGRKITVCIEPEPGCALDTSNDMVSFFENFLFTGLAETDQRVRRYITVCHDLCHAAVMQERQADFIQRLSNAGIEIGKVQISSAVEANFSSETPEQNEQAWEQLLQFNEPRYLHQTTVQRPDHPVAFYEDLHLAIAEHEDPKSREGRWRVHFHVPIYLDSFGALKATREDLIDGIAQAKAAGVKHFEVETYAWNVVPDSLKQPTLASGIAEEMQYAAKTIDG